MCCCVFVIVFFFVLLVVLVFVVLYIIILFLVLLVIVVQLCDQVLVDDIGWKVVELFIIEIGLCIVGSEVDVCVVVWVEVKFKVLGFDKVWKELVIFLKWEWCSEYVVVIGKNLQLLQIIVLGGSLGGIVEVEVVCFVDLVVLQVVLVGLLKGKIVFVDYQMLFFCDGCDYGRGGVICSKGLFEVICKGVVGFLMCLVGIDLYCVFYIGIICFDEGLILVLLVVLLVFDVDQLVCLLVCGSIMVKVVLDCGWDGIVIFYNVIGEIIGCSLLKEVVVIGGYLDLWDLGIGVVDDGVGVGIIMVVGYLIGQFKQVLKCIICVIVFVNEEQGLYGGKVYVEVYVKDVVLYQLVVESDFGVGCIYVFNIGLLNLEGLCEVMKQIVEVMKLLGIEYQVDKGGLGLDVGLLVVKGGVWVWLVQDGLDYFYLYYIVDDMLDKIDLKVLVQNVVVYIVFVYLVVEVDGSFGSEVKVIMLLNE